MKKRAEVVLLTLGIAVIFLLTAVMSVSAEERTFFEICAEGTPAEVRAALEAGANVNQRYSRGRTPLMAAAEQNPNSMVALYLLSAGARVDLVDNEGWTALMYAAAYNSDHRVLSTLLSFGARINNQNRKGDTALILALREGKNENIDLLIRQRANLNLANRQGITPLMEAVKHSRELRLIERLIDRGAELDTKDDQGLTALMYAVQKNQFRTVRQLVESGAKINLVNQSNQNALIIALKNEVDLRIYEYLLAENIEINVKDNRGRTAVHHALENEAAYSVIEMLLSYRGDPNIADNLGYNALHYAVLNNRAPEILNMLIAAGAAVDKESVQKETPLLLAAEEVNNIDVFSILLDQNSDINKADYRGTTPLMRALEFNTEKVVEILLNKGADPVQRDHHGRSTVDYMVKNENIVGTDVYWYIRYQQPEGEKVDFRETKSRLTAGLLSFAVPSGGHYYAGRWWPKGAMFLAGEAGLLALAYNLSDPGAQRAAYTALGLVKIWEIYDVLGEIDEINEFVSDYNLEAERYNEYPTKNGGEEYFLNWSF